MSSTDSGEDDASRSSGPHPRFESVRFFRPEQTSHDDALTPRERLSAARDAATGGEGGYEPTIHSPTVADGGGGTVDPTRVEFAVEKGDDTLGERIEVDLSNTTTGPITDTLTAGLYTVTVETASDGTETETLTPLWALDGGADGDTGTADHGVTLAGGATTTVAISGDGRASVSGFVDPDDGELVAAGGGLSPLPVRTTVRAVVSTTNQDPAISDPALSIDRTRVAVSPTPWEQWWRDDGALLLRGPRGPRDIRVFYPPAESFALFPGGAKTTALAADAIETTTLESGGVHTHTTSGDYDLTTPRGDGERERYSSGLGGFAVSLTGGHGRVNQGWNCIYDNSQGVWRYAVSGEPAMAIDFNGGSVALMGAPTGTAGDPISWNEVEYDGTNDVFDMNGATVINAATPSGPTADRPANPDVGWQYFDTDLGYAISYNGTNWVDGQGAVV